MIRPAVLFLAALLMAHNVPARAEDAPKGLFTQDGRRFDEASLTGGWHLVYFGYTQCPDICPTSLFEMTAAIDRLPVELRPRVTPVFVTVDPARDTSAVMSNYVKPLGHGFVTVSGDIESIDRFAFRNKIVAIRHLDQGADYLVDHSSYLLLFGPDGREIERFPYDMDFQEVSRRIGAHMAATSPASPGAG